MRFVIFVVAAAALAACSSQASQPQAGTSNAPSATQPVNVPTDISTPPGMVAFPDFNEFTAADTKSYSDTNWHHDEYVAFRTDSGVSCFAYVYGARALGNISCDSRRMPGFPVNANGQEHQGTPRTESVLREPSNGPFQFWVTTSTVDDSVKVLPAGQRLVVNDTGCAVGDEGLLACIDGDRHGFVVSPKGSWGF
jgi:hypothetical protein